MNATDNSHVPFAQLAPELRFIYGLAATAAILQLGPYLEAIQATVSNASVIRIWDEYKFTPADALGFFHDAARLEPYLVHFAVKDPGFWCPRIAARRSLRRNRK